MKLRSLAMNYRYLRVRVTMIEMRREIDLDALFHAGNISPRPGYNILHTGVPRLLLPRWHGVAWGGTQFIPGQIRTALRFNSVSLEFVVAVTSIQLGDPEDGIHAIRLRALVFVMHI